jgi:hypothetical protein
MLRLTSRELLSRFVAFAVGLLAACGAVFDVQVHAGRPAAACVDGTCHPQGHVVGHSVPVFHGHHGLGHHLHGHHGCGPRCGCHQCIPGCEPLCGGHLHHFDGHWLHHDVYEKRYFLRSQCKSWHSAWYDPAEGRPIALVVPPTSEFQTQYGWGVPSSRVAPIYHQFRRPYPGPGAVAGGGGRFLPTPNQPSDTVQFGVNAVRGPWGAY